MMKVKTMLALGLCFAGTASFNAHADVATALANICNIVQGDDKSELRKKLRNVESGYAMKLADYYDGIQCNGNSLIRTALLSNAVETGKLLVKKLPKSKLGEPEQDGLLLTDWIASKGLESSEIAATVKARM